MTRIRLCFFALGLSLTAALPALGQLSVQAWNPGGLNRIVVADSQGNLLDGYVRIGFFGTDAENANNTSILTGSDALAIDSLFHALGENNDTYGTLDVGTSQTVTNGIFNIRVIDISPDVLPPDIQLFLWFLDAPTPAEATEWAIVTDYDLPWKSIAVNPNLGFGIISTFFPTTANVTESDVVRGTLVDTQLRLAPVPEPATITLAGMAAVWGLRRRRVR